MAAMNPGFRQDIQGLRALAVLLVILDHARIGPFHGGFIGVDVFFVISGFLITGLLVSEAERTGRASLLGFYARRARRILPAATLVILATVAASVYFLSAVEANGAIEDALWATFFAANFKFARDGTDYFQNDTPPSPLQHYWSLSVEEQFYLVWPLLVLLLCLYAAWRARRSAGARSLGPRVRDLGVSPLVVIVGVSFAYSVSFSTTDPVSAYFSPFTRAWELGFGALVACLSTRLILLKPSVQALMSWAGLAAVVVAALVFDATTVFPGYAAAVPVVGTAALLAGGLRAASWGPQWLLSVRPMRLVGDWSYSLYLWHWPVLIIVSEAWKPAVGWLGVLVIAAVVPLSAATYYFVENPFRRAKVFRVRRLRGALLYPAVVILTLPMLAAANNVVESELTGGGPPITVAEFGQGGPQQDQVVALVQASVKAAEDGLRHPGRPQAVAARPRHRHPRPGQVPVLRDQRRPAALPARRHRRRQDAGADRRLARPAVGAGARRAVQALRLHGVLPDPRGLPLLRRHAVDGARRAEHRLRGVPGVGAPAGRGAAAGRRAARVGGEPARLHRRRRPARERRSDDGDDVPRGHGAARSTTCRRTPAGSS